MKIDSIILREIRMPLVQPFQTSFGTTTDRRIMLVEIRAEGITGWGECVAGEHPYFPGAASGGAPPRSGARRQMSWYFPAGTGPSHGQSGP